MIRDPLAGSFPAAFGFDPIYGYLSESATAQRHCEMSRSLPDQRAFDLSRALLEREAAINNVSDANSPLVFRVFEKLRLPLGTLAGANGFRVLLSRALTLARPNAAGLAALTVKQDGSLEGLGQLSNHEATGAGVALMVELLGLLAAFIGEPLTMQIVSDVWPDLNGFGISRSGESEHEPTR